MEFLKDLLGEELYSKVESKINEHNGNEANKDKQIKLGNLGGGEYVSKGKYDSEIEKLNNLLAGKTTELDTANNLISDLKRGTKGNEDMQGKITEYETVTIPALQKQIKEEKLSNALKIALLSEKATDIDYLTFKVNEKLAAEGKTLELDDNDNIKGWNNVLAGLKTQFPTQFENGKSNVIEPIPLPTREDKGNEITKEQFDKMGYSSRAKLHAENPELYSNLMKG